MWGEGGHAEACSAGVPAMSHREASIGTGNWKANYNGQYNSGDAGWKMKSNKFLYKENRQRKIDLP